MATVSREIADAIVRGEYAEDRPVKIVRYINAWDGISYGVIYEGDDPNKYAETDFVRYPSVYWEIGK